VTIKCSNPKLDYLLDLKDVVRFSKDPGNEKEAEISSNILILC